MRLQTMTAPAWQAQVAARAEAMNDRAMAKVLSRFQLLPRGMDPAEISAGVHPGDLAVDGDFTPQTIVTLIEGDLSVRGKLSTENVDGMDGNATLVVLGDVRCERLVNDWASLLIVAGDLIVGEWAFAAREDSALVVGKDFRTPIFDGADIWASVGGLARMGAGYGYAVDLAAFDDAYGARQIHPERDWRDLVDALGLEVEDEEQLMEALETRLYATGTLARPG